MGETLIQAPISHVHTLDTMSTPSKLIMEYQNQKGNPLTTFS